MSVGKNHWNGLKCFFLSLSAWLRSSDFLGNSLFCTPLAEKEEEAGFGENFPDHSLDLLLRDSRVTLNQNRTKIFLNLNFSFTKQR